MPQKNKREQQRHSECVAKPAMRTHEQYVTTQNMDHPWGQVLVNAESAEDEPTDDNGENQMCQPHAAGVAQ